MISVITPSIRKEMLSVLNICLHRQTTKDFEWLVASPTDMDFGSWVPEPPKREGDYYGLNKAWNAAFKVAKGELVVSIQDGIWFPPDLLERFWDHYEANPTACIGAVGDQYDQMENWKPEHCVWRDPRKDWGNSTFMEIPPRDLEYSVASIPLKAIKDAGYIDEEFDKYAALSEKELNARIGKLGYKFYLDKSLEYRAIKHPRLNNQWEEHYQAGIKYYNECLAKL